MLRSRSSAICTAESHQSPLRRSPYSGEQRMQCCCGSRTMHKLHRRIADHTFCSWGDALSRRTRGDRRRRRARSLRSPHVCFTASLLPSLPSCSHTSSGLVTVRCPCLCHEPISSDCGWFEGKRMDKETKDGNKDKMRMKMTIRVSKYFPRPSSSALSRAG